MIRSDNTISDNELFPVCSAVLDEYITPMHYRDLTMLAVRKLGYDESKLNMFRQIEDVRERLPRAVRRDYGVVYAGSPFSLMAKRSWFPVIRPALINVDFIDRPVVMPASIPIAVEGAKEALMRAPYMQSHGNDLEMRNFLRAKGLIVEAHVKSWFRKMYPDFYREPSNHNRWDKPAPEDFFLNIGGQWWPVDVASPGRSGKYGSMKRPTRIHIVCSINSAGVVVLEGVLNGELWKETPQFSPEITVSPYVLLARLNCQCVGIDYASLLDAIKAHNH